MKLYLERFGKVYWNSNGLRVGWEGDGFERIKQLARRLSEERFEHVLVDVGGFADLYVPYVLAIAFEKASRVL